MIAMLNKTILFIADHLKGGGAERILLEAATLLAENNTVIIALLDSNDIRMWCDRYYAIKHLISKNKG